MKYIKLSFLGLFLLITNSASLSAQKNTPELSFGILYADVKTRTPSWRDGNPFRRGAWLTLQQNNKLWNWFHLDTGITYQERMPLEVMSFAPGNSTTGTAGIATLVTLFAYPTNPQNELFDNQFKEYLRLPNFKYLNLEIIPNITFEKVLSFEIGVGVFAGILLNKNDKTVSKEDLPNEKIAFDAGQMSGEVLYRKYDYGWIPKAAIAYQINDKIKVGLQFKSYQSFSRLNDTFVFKQKSLNMKWIAHAGGLSMQYKF